jgi:hypothetical protein
MQYAQRINKFEDLRMIWQNKCNREGHPNQKFGVVDVGHVATIRMCDKCFRNFQAEYNLWLHKNGYLDEDAVSILDVTHFHDSIERGVHTGD